MTIGTRDDFTILIVAGSIPSLFVLDSQPSDKFIFQDRVYSRVQAEDCNGYYDWLRQGSGEIIGIRHSLFEPMDLLTSSLSGLPYCRIIEREIVLIYFSEARNFDEVESCDQEFGGEGIWIAENGTIALSFYYQETEKNALIQDQKTSSPVRTCLEN